MKKAILFIILIICSAYLVYAAPVLKFALSSAGQPGDISLTGTVTVKYHKIRQKEVDNGLYTTKLWHDFGTITLESSSFKEKPQSDEWSFQSDLVIYSHQLDSSEYFMPAQIEIAIASGPAHYVEDKSTSLKFPEENKVIDVYVYEMKIQVAFFVSSSVTDCVAVRLARPESILSDDTLSYSDLSIRFNLRVEFLSRLNDLYIYQIFFDDKNASTAFIGTNKEDVFEILDDGSIRFHESETDWWFQSEFEDMGFVGAPAATGASPDIFRDGERLEYPRTVNETQYWWKLDGVYFEIPVVLRPPRAMVHDHKNDAVYSQYYAAWGDAWCIYTLTAYVFRGVERKMTEKDKTSDPSGSLRDPDIVLIDTDYASSETIDLLEEWAEMFNVDKSTAMIVMLILAFFAIIVIIIIVLALFKFALGGGGSSAVIMR
ncbi:MAG: hypothetical protein Q6363_007835 [Candidatus Njordarchaeota archaeon]